MGSAAISAASSSRCRGSTVARSWVSARPKRPPPLPRPPRRDPSGRRGASLLLDSSAPREQMSRGAPPRSGRYSWATSQPIALDRSPSSTRTRSCVEGPRNTPAAENGAPVAEAAASVGSRCPGRAFTTGHPDWVGWQIPSVARRRRCMVTVRTFQLAEKSPRAACGKPGG
jgi:hypothetical protein